jgi:hypothetical protein
MSNRRRWLVGLAAVMLAMFTAGTALGYDGEVAGSVTVARPSGTLQCGVNIAVSATVVDKNGKRIAGQPVTWRFLSTPTSQDKIKSTTTFTDSRGVARTNVFLACVPGSRVIRAQADRVYGSATLNVTAAGLPNTSTLPAGTPAPAQLPVLGTLLALLALTVGGGLAVRGVVASRR